MDTIGKEEGAHGTHVYPFLDTVSLILSLGRDETRGEGEGEEEVDLSVLAARTLIQLHQRPFEVQICLSLLTAALLV